MSCSVWLEMYAHFYWSRLHLTWIRSCVWKLQIHWERNLVYNFVCGWRSFTIPHVAIVLRVYWFLKKLYKLIRRPYFRTVMIVNYKVCKLSDESNLPKFWFFSNINIILFKIVPLGGYIPKETLFPLLVAALEVFNQYGLQHVRYTLLDVF